MGVRSFLALPGTLGVAQTIGVMRHSVHESLQHPEVVDLAERIVAAYQPEEYAEKAEAIKRFTENHFQFREDPEDVEDVTAAHIHVQRIADKGITEGDCDDLSVLQAALLSAAGVPAYFMTSGVGDVSVLGNRFNHVYVEALTQNGPHLMDWLPISKEPANVVGNWGAVT